jgi:predicted nucleotidyltransferase
VGFVSKHSERDSALPKYRDVLLKNALNDLTNDCNVLAIYVSGSLAKGNFDNYSDIDLHTIVTPEKKADFIKEKRNRASKWGEVLFYEDVNPSSPVVVTHFDCFIKVDSWYHTIEEVVPSIWLKGLEVRYDPHNLISNVIKESSNIVYKPSKEEVEFWRGKVMAFIHETYRAVMRNELFYALANLDRVRWFIASGWYMEMDEHLDSSYGVWSKIEGERSKLTNQQLSLLKSWNCSRNHHEIMGIIREMMPELLRVNKILCKRVEIEENEKLMLKVLQMVT